MKLFCFYLIAILFFITTGCYPDGKKEASRLEASRKEYGDGMNEGFTVQEPESPFDSMVRITAALDTTGMEGKRDYLLNQFAIEGGYTMYDTVMDLNYDGKDDYVIGYYGGAGNGIKNRVMVYLYDTDHYVLNDQLTGIANPTFYLSKKKITGFYIAGRGTGGRLEWINRKWVEAKTFRVEHEDKHGNAVWEISYPLENRREKVVREFQMIPPEDILETDVSF